MKTEVDSIKLQYLNSIGMNCEIMIPLRGKDNLMEIIRDYGYEDWGECRGRTWCRTCHVGVSKSIDDEMMPLEKEALSQIEQADENSRLACQMTINSSLDGLKIHYLGDDLI